MKNVEKLGCNRPTYSKNISVPQSYCNTELARNSHVSNSYSTHNSWTNCLCGCRVVATLGSTVLIRVCLCGCSDTAGCNLRKMSTGAVTHEWVKRICFHHITCLFYTLVYVHLNPTILPPDTPVPIASTSQCN